MTLFGNRVLADGPIEVKSLGLALIQQLRPYQRGKPGQRKTWTQENAIWKWRQKWVRGYPRWPGNHKMLRGVSQTPSQLSEENHLPTPASQDSRRCFPTQTSAWAAMCGSLRWQMQTSKPEFHSPSSSLMTAFLDSPTSYFKVQPESPCRPSLDTGWGQQSKFLLCKPACFCHSCSVSCTTSLTA